jgi:hypothetical protein
MNRLEKLIAEASRDGRVCPRPMAWKRLWQLLPSRRRIGAGSDPPVPLIPGAWWEASDSYKRERFHLRLRWASEHGAIDAVAHLLSTMKPAEWHTEQ